MSNNSAASTLVPNSDIRNKENTVIPAGVAVTVLPSVAVMSKAGYMDKKTFLATAKPLVLTSADGKTTLILSPKEFSTGSWGFGFNGPAYVTVGDTITKLQVGINAPVASRKRTQRWLRRSSGVSGRPYFSK